MSDIDSTVSLDQSIQSVSIDATLSISGTVTAIQSTQGVVVTVNTVYPSALQSVQSVSVQASVHYDLNAAITQPVQALTVSGYAIDIEATATTTQTAQSVSVDATVTVFSDYSSVTQPKQRLTSYATQSTVTAPTAEAMAAKFVVSSRRDLQIPRIPLNQDKQTQAWFTSVGKIIQKYIFGEDGSRLVSAADLAKLGIVGVNPNGTVTTPRGNLTTPPKITGLTANGALASIVIQWRNPSFLNYGYTELWRSSVDDIGQAVIIAKTAVESYIDNVGSAATKYYWARAVTDSGVHGEFNAASGVLGQTSYDPEYVKQLLTTVKWLPNTTYAPYQYIQPTVDNGYQYMVIDGGVSASTEPTWPTTVSHTVSDGTIEWQCISAADRLPLVIGELEDGSPAVFIDTAFIKDASITSAKIGDLVADKITTGDLNANIRILQKLFYGFDEFANPDELSGFWLGVEDDVPKFRLDTGAAHGNKSLIYDGVDLRLTGDGLFDDMYGDAIRFNRIAANIAVVNSLAGFTDYVAETGIPFGDPLISSYAMYASPMYKTKSSVSFCDPFDVPLITLALNTEMLPYNEPSNSLFKFKSKSIKFAILVDFGLGNNGGGHPGIPIYNLEIVDETASVIATGLVELDTTTVLSIVTGGTLTLDTTQVLYNTVPPFGYPSRAKILMVCHGDSGALNYLNNKRLTARIYGGGSGPSLGSPDTFYFYFQLFETNVPNFYPINDAILSI